MSNSPQMADEVHLTLIAGSSDAQNNSTCNQVIISLEQRAASCCEDNNHRKLAISSIICGISCIGIMALINSVKAEEAKDPRTAAKFTQRAKKYGIISIVTWVAILVLTPVLMVLISYLLTLQD